MRGPSLHLTTLLLLVWGCSALAQVAIEGGQRAGRPQLPAYGGQVERFTLAPGGVVDGLLLTDGTEVETPPYLSAQMTAAIRPGDHVTVRGLKAASLSLLQAVTIADERTGFTVVDRGLSAPPEPPRPLAGVPVRREGRIRVLLHGPRGEVNGLLLDDGTTIRVDLIEASQVPPAYRPGSFVVVEGVAQASPYGTVIRATAIGVRTAGSGTGRSP